MDGWPIRFWNEWAIQILVLLSFSLQIILLLLAGIRRHEDFPVLRFLLWLAYQLADSTAIYALGLLSLTSSATRDNELVAFWAPFLLLHLGGPDNITAYALEDNQLWKRHLLTVFVQVLGATYVLYQHVAASGGLSFILVATMLMFAIGVVKYAERTWALKRGNMDDIRSSLKNYGVKDDRNINPKGVANNFNEQVLLEVAHFLFHFCKLRLVDSAVNMDRPRLGSYNFGWADMWKMVEMELSLLYDIMYTKAAIAHTWIGYLVRFIAPPATATAFVLFQLHLMMTRGVTDHRRIDVAITYALLAGAFFMEVTALLAAVGSTWTLAFLSNLPMRWSSIRHALVCSGRWHRLRCLLLSIGRLDIRRRRWSGTIGQYNLFHLCTRDSGGNLVGRLAKMLGMEERWNRFHYSGSFVLPEDLKEFLFFRYHQQMSDENNVNALGLLRQKWGDLAVEKHKQLEKIWGKIGRVELQEDIALWHIATNVYLANRVKHRVEDYTTVRNIEVLSNYMMFLLVNRPYLLPGLVLHRMYNTSCVNLEQIWSDEHDKSRVPAGAGSVLNKLFQLHDDPVISSTTRASQGNQLAEILHRLMIQKFGGDHNLGDTKEEDYFSSSAYRVQYGATFAYNLLWKDKHDQDWTSSKSLEVILDVWLDFLFYVANRCSRESYARKLNSGVELTAILWLMGAHFEPILKSS